MRRHFGDIFGELLQPVPEARRIEGKDTGTSRRLDESSLDAQGMANLQRCYYFKDQPGSNLHYREAM